MSQLLSSLYVAPWLRRPGGRNVPKSCQPGPGQGLPRAALRGRVPSALRAELGPGWHVWWALYRPCHEVTSHRAVQGGCSFNRSFYQHSSASPRPGGDPLAPPGMTTPRKMFPGREAAAGVRGQTFQGQMCNSSAASGPLQGREASAAPC